MTGWIYHNVPFSTKWLNALSQLAYTLQKQVYMASIWARLVILLTYPPVNEETLFHAGFFFYFHAEGVQQGLEGSLSSEQQNDRALN